MKRTLSLLLCVALLLALLSACQGPVTESPSTSSLDVVEIEWTVSELIVMALEDSGYEDDNLEAFGEYYDLEALTFYIENAYGLQESWEDAAVIRATGVSAFEIAVLCMADSATATQAVTVLENYIADREGDFVGYAPAEADMVANSRVMQNGQFVVLLICPDPSRAYERLDLAFKGEIHPEPAEFTIPEDAITDVKELRDWLVSYCGIEGANLEMLDNSDPDALTDYIEDSYGLKRDQRMDCAIARGTGDTAFEVAVMTGKNDWAISSDVRKYLDWYLNGRQIVFQNDAEQKSMLSQAMSFTAVAGSGEYV